MPTTTKFCTLDDVKAYLTNGTGYYGDDAAILVHIKAATALIRAYTRRSWEAGTFVQVFSTRDINIAINMGNGVARFSLKEKPASAITKVVYHTGGKFDTATEEPTNTYSLDTDKNALIMYPYSMSSNGRALEVTYTAGYAIDTVDTELLLVAQNLVSATAIQAAFMFKRVLNETQGSSQKQDKKGFVNYGLTTSGLITDALSMIKGETRLLVGNG